MADRIITNFKGETKSVECIGCLIEQGDHSTTVFTSDYFSAQQDYEIPIPGFIIIASRRHIRSIEEFTPEEINDFTKTLTKTRKALHEVLGIDIVYLHQEEDSSDHFHVWMLPRYDWMTEKFGKGIESVRPIMEYAKANFKTPENLQKVDEAINKLKKILTSEF